MKNVVEYLIAEGLDATSVSAYSESQLLNVSSLIELLKHDPLTQNLLKKGIFTTAELISAARHHSITADVIEKINQLEEAHHLIQDRVITLEEVLSLKSNEMRALIERPAFSKALRKQRITIDEIKLYLSLTLNDCLKGGLISRANIKLLTPEQQEGFLQEIESLAEAKVFTKEHPLILTTSQCETLKSAAPKRFVNLLELGLVTSLNSPFIIYPSRGGAENYNLRFLSIDKEEVACRHLAFEFLCAHKHESHGKGMDYRQFVNSQENINKNPRLKDSWFDKENVEWRADQYFDAPLKKIGLALYKACEGIQQDKPKQLLFASENHMMAFVLEKKSKEGREYYSLKFYDPNKTEQHLRLTFQSLEELKQLKIRDLLSQDSRSVYFPKIKSGFLALYNDTEHISPQKPVRELIELPGSVPSLYHLLSLGAAEQVTKRVQNFMENNKLDSAKLKKLLKARNAKGRLGIERAIILGHSTTIRAYRDCILGSHILSSEDKKELLSPIYQASLLQFCFAFRDDDTAKVTDFVESILKSDLSAEDKKELLSQKDETSVADTTILIDKLKSGHTATVVAYCNCVLNSTLSQEDKKQLVTVKWEDPSVFWDGHIETIIAYCNCIQDTTMLSPRDKMDLLMLIPEDYVLPNLDGEEASILIPYIETMVSNPFFLQNFHLLNETDQETFQSICEEILEEKPEYEKIKRFHPEPTSLPEPTLLTKRTVVSRVTKTASIDMGTRPHSIIEKPMDKVDCIRKAFDHAKIEIDKLFESAEKIANSTDDLLASDECRISLTQNFDGLKKIIGDLQHTLVEAKVFVLTEFIFDVLSQGLQQYFEKEGNTLTKGQLTVLFTSTMNALNQDNPTLGAKSSLGFYKYIKELTSQNLEVLLHASPESTESHLKPS